MLPRLIALLLILLCQGALRAQDKEGDNPTGPSGNFNGEVTTAGCYDPYTGNIKRQVTDLTAPGANGAYPLALVRTYNSNYFSMGSDLVFGDGSNWRHSYQWTLIKAAYAPGTTIPTAYTVAYPGGAAITFRSGRPIAPSQELSSFWRGPSGTTDRLEVQDPSHVYLHTADGGMVNFGNAAHPSSIVDPNGAITLLTYMSNNTNYLAQVTEPGGRWLKFSYTTYTYRGAGYSYSWTLLSQVQASNGQTVTYSEAATGSQTNGLGQIYPYYVLTGASYDQEASTSGGSVLATYTYNMVARPLPTLLTAVDPHYAGAMVNIRYAGGGLSFQEENLGTSELVSGCVITYPSSGITIGTETRGDKSSGTGNNSAVGATITRTFNYGSPVKPSLLSSVRDFEGQTSYKSYYGAGDPNGKSFLMSTTDALGHIVSYQHEPLTGRVTQIKFADGRTRAASWLAADDTNTLLPYYLYQTTDERGLSITRHHYPGSGLVSKIDYPDGSHEHFQYAAFSGNGGTFYKLSVFTNRLGGQIIYSYDEAGHGGSGHPGLLTSVTRSYQVGSSTVPVHETTAFTYDSFDRVIQSTDPRGIADSYSYNSRHQVVKVTHVNDGSTIAIGYDDYGNCISVQDENGNTKTALYDEYRRLVTVSTPVNAPDAAGVQIASRYEAFSYLRYDNTNNIWGDAQSNTNSNWGAKWMPSGSAVQRVFSPNGLCADQDDGMYVNGSGNPILPAVANGFAYTAKAYNAIGQLDAVTDPLGFTTTFTYDACNRFISSTDAAGHVTSRAYYGNGERSNGGSQTICAGLLKSLTTPSPDDADSPETVTTNYTDYDPMGLVKSVQDPFSHVFSSTFDSGGDLASQTDGLHSTPYLYDQLGRRINCTYQDNTTEQWTYDASGNLSTFKNRAGATCTCQYADGRNRCTSYSWSDGTSSVSYLYYPNGLLQEASNAHSDIKYVYDSSNALIAEKELTAQPTRMVTRYTHDLDGNVDSITYPSGHVSIFTHDAQERVTGMSFGGSAMSYYAYTGDWQTLRWLANGLDTRYAYQKNGRLSFFWDYRGDSAGNHVTNGSVSIQYYGYAPDGQVSWTQRQAGGDQTGRNSPVEYNLGDAYYYYPDGTFNAAFRNINAAGGWPGQESATADSRVSASNFIYYTGSTASAYDAYTYDAAGNRTRIVRDSQLSSYPATDSLNRYVTWGYDTNGNATNPLLGWTYQYNAENQLIQANGPGGVVLQYAYDAAGRLVERVVNGVPSFFYYAGAQRIEERDANLSLVYSYYYEVPGSDRLLCRQDAAWGLLWYLYDGQGNVTHLCDNAGNVLERYLYDAFGTPTVYDPSGNQRPAGSAYDNRYLFKSAGGYEWQPQSQLYYCRERFYLPYHGRWLQPDPIGQAGGLNIYNYCGNDPINSIDPSGLAGIEVIGSPVDVSAGIDVRGNVPDAAAFTFGPEGSIDPSFLDTPIVTDFGNHGEVTLVDPVPSDTHTRGASSRQQGSNIGLGIAGAAAVGVDVTETATAITTAPVAIPAAVAVSIAAGLAQVVEEEQGALDGLEQLAQEESTFEALSSAASRAADSVGNGFGRAYGTLVHTAFRKTVETLNNPNLFTERSYLNGDPARYGTPGSIRVDVGEGTVEAPTAIFDLKTGNAALTPARILQIQSHLPGGASVPVYQLRP